MFALAVIAAVCVAAQAQSSPNVCDLTRIPVQPDFKPELWRGAWFEAWFYPRQSYDRSSHYTDYVYEVTPVAGTQDMQIKELTKDNRPGTLANGCRIANDARRYYEANAKYYYYKSQTGQNNVRSWIVETDYNTYAIEFLCYDVRGNVCYDSEVSLWTRVPGDANRALKAQVRHKFEALHAQLFSCIKLNEVREIRQNFLSNLHGTCSSMGITYPGYGYPSQLPYYPNTMPYYPYTNAMMMDPAMVTARKEQLIAMKEKLMSEKEVLDLDTEKLRLQVAILRRGGNLPHH